LSSQLKTALVSVPKHAGDSGETPIHRDLEAVLIRAEEVSTEMEDKYIGVNHLLLAICDNDKIFALLSAIGGDKDKLTTALKAERGGRYKAGEAGPAEFENLLKYATDI